MSESNNAENSQEYADMEMSDREWDAGMELALLNAISQCKPVGNRIKSINQTNMLLILN